MESSKLTERLRGILRSDVGSGSTPISAPIDVAAVGVPPDLSLESVLGGQWREAGGGRSFVVEQRTPGDLTYGGGRVGDLAHRLERGSVHASILAAGAAVRPPFFFFDLETTGLCGGAGTCAFLVGCGWFADAGAFVTRQYLMVGYGDERSMLEAVGAELQQAGTLVSFNGKAFDGPVLQTRYLFHRLDWPAAHLPHLDVLHPARRFWSGPAVRGRHEMTPFGRGAAAQETREASRDQGSDCSLVGLEQNVLGVCRRGDVPGFEIPARYFRFLRSRDAQPLVAVLQHNKLDLLSLAGLTARLLQLVERGPGEARDGREALALGKLYLRAGDCARAHEAFERAAARADAQPLVMVDALRSLALAERRARRHDRAAARWHQVLDCPECPSHVMREATEALAIHHEHRLRDLETARVFALRGANDVAHSTWTASVRHRIARIERKLSAERPLLS